MAVFMLCSFNMLSSIAMLQDDLAVPLIELRPFSFNAQLKRINWVLYTVPSIVNSVRAAHSILHSYGSTKYTAWSSRHGYSSRPSLVSPDWGIHTVLDVSVYRNVPTFHGPSQFDVRIPLFSADGAVVRPWKKQPLTTRGFNSCGSRFPTFLIITNAS